MHIPSILTDPRATICNRCNVGNCLKPGESIRCRACGNCFSSFVPLPCGNLFVTPRIIIGRRRPVIPKDPRVTMICNGCNEGNCLKPGESIRCRRCDQVILFSTPRVIGPIGRRRADVHRRLDI